MEPNQNILYLIRGLMRLQEQYIEGVRRAHGLSHIEVIIISFLYNNPGHDTASDISEMRMLQKGNVSQGVESLIQKALLRRSPDAHDRRRIHLSLTEAALPIVREIEARQLLLFEQMFDGFSAEERQQYAGYNARVFENVISGLERK